MPVWKNIGKNTRYLPIWSNQPIKRWPRNQQLRLFSQTFQASQGLIRSRPGGWNTVWSRWFTKLIDLCFFPGPGISNQQIPTKCQGISEKLRWDENILEGKISEHSTPSSNCTLASFGAISLSVVEEGSAMGKQKNYGKTQCHFMEEKHELL